MGQQFSQLEAKHIEFIQQQHLYFVATAAPEGLVNVSPKGMDTFRVVNESLVAWMNLTGSGNESAAHIQESPRMTIMFCSFDRQPVILRLYTTARVIHPRDPEWNQQSALFPDHPGARQIFSAQINLVQSSCGFAVPFYEFVGERDTLSKWTQGKGEQGIEEYWQTRNALSLDNKPTGI